MKILVFDPSGNFAEGKGTTGYAVFEDERLIEWDDIPSKEYDSAERYWHSHATFIKTCEPDLVIYETYKLQMNKAMQQSWSELETPQLIGVIRWMCFRLGIPCIGQDPSIKGRFSDKVLLAMGLLSNNHNQYFLNGERTNMHQRDAIRHGMYYMKYTLGKDAIIPIGV